MSLGLLRNEDAARSDKLMGAKAQAVRNIMIHNGESYVYPTFSIQ